MKKLLTSRITISPLGFLLFLLIFCAVHLVAFATGDYALLRLFYPMLCLALVAKALFYH